MNMKTHISKLGCKLMRMLGRGPSVVIVGCSNPDFWYRLEGKDPATVCHQCSGDGQLSTAGPREKETPDKVIDCPDCKGTGLRP